MRLSYAILACNEVAELRRLLRLLITNIDDKDEIAIVLDEGNHSQEILDEIIEAEDAWFPNTISVEIRPLANHFAKQKNYLNSLCTGDYIVQLDADELLSKEFLTNIKQVISMNAGVEAFWVPRINIVNGLTEEHIKKWNWQVNDRGWVNFPDFQNRIFLNSKNIKWEFPVHERLKGYKSVSFLPESEEYCIYHVKDIMKQEKQNKFYETI